MFNFAQGALVLFAALTFVFLVEYGEGEVICVGSDGWLGSRRLAALFYLFAVRS